MKKFALAFLATLLFSSFSSAQRLEDLGRGLVKDLVTDLTSKTVGSLATRQQKVSIDDLLDQANTDLNKDAGTGRLPKGTTASIEVDSNQTDVPTAQLVGIAKASLRNWWDGLVPAANFDDRNDVQHRNGRDRDNEELRNPIPKGQMTRSGYDVHITSVQRQGASNLNIGGGIFQKVFFRIAGVNANYGSMEQLKFIQLTIDIRNAATQESVLTVQVVGADLQGYGVDFNLQTRSFSGSYRQDSYNNISSRAIADAFDRARFIAENPVKPKSKRRR